MFDFRIISEKNFTGPIAEHSVWQAPSSENFPDENTVGPNIAHRCKFFLPQHFGCQPFYRKFSLRIFHTEKNY